MDQSASPDVVYALQQMGFERDACVLAAVACNNDVQASTDWLIAAGDEREHERSRRNGEAQQQQHQQELLFQQAHQHQQQDVHLQHAQQLQQAQQQEIMLQQQQHAADAAEDAEEGAERGSVGEAIAGVGGETWRLVGGHPMDPLNAIAGADQLNIHDTGMGGWVVMNGAFGVAEPLLFVGERSTWYGKVFAGRSRQAAYDLIDTSSRPLVTVDKTFSLTDTRARVSLVPQRGEAAVGPTAGAQGDLLIGTITSEWDAIKRRLVLVDSTPNLAVGAIALESPSIFDDTFRIKLGNAVLGTITRPRRGAITRRRVFLSVCDRDSII